MNCSVCKAPGICICPTEPKKEASKSRKDAFRDDTLQWAVDRWRAEVANRPLVNIHRRTLDGTWRQVIRHMGGDDEALCGPCHDQLLAVTS